MILVIGATGYIGRYLCVDMLSRGLDVLALGRSNKARDFFNSNGVPFQYFDFDAPNCFDKLPADNVEAIVDLSAKLAEIETPVEEFFKINTIGVYRTLDFAQRAGIKKVVVTSTHKVYNDISKTIISEEDGISFKGDHSPYIISKIAAENFVEYYNKDYNMNAVALRLTGVHGYGEILGHLNTDGTYQKSTFEIFFEKALKGEPISVWGDQSVKRDHIYIKDVISAICAAISSERARGIYNIASGVGYSQYEEALTLAKVFGSEDKISKVTIDPGKKGLTRGYVYNISKAKKELNWEPHFSNLEKLLIDYKKEWLLKKYHNYHVIRDNQRPKTF